MALVFNRDFDPLYGEAVRVGAGVRRVTAANPGPFTFRGTNTFLIGDREVAILDPGPADTAHIDAVMRAVSGASVAHILVSHSHADHSAGAALLQARTGAPILAAGQCAAAPAPAGQHPAPRLDASSDVPFRPDIDLSDGEIVEGRDYRLEAIATPGHAADHLAFALLGADLIFPGDHVMGWSTTVVAPPDGSMGDYIRSLERLLARSESCYFPAHGSAVPDAHAYMRDLLEHRKAREQAILARLRAGDRTITDMLPRIYGGLAPALIPAAGLSTLAHLEDLVGRGLVRTDGSPSLSGRYWVAG